MAAMAAQSCGGQCSLEVFFIYFYGRRRCHHDPIYNHYLYTLFRSLTPSPPPINMIIMIMHIYTSCLVIIHRMPFSSSLENHVFFTF